MDSENNRANEITSLLGRLAELLTVTNTTESTVAVRPMPNRLLLTVEETAERLGIGRTKVFALVKSGEIESVQIGRLRRVPVEAINDYARHLIANQRNAA
jgi:excisionase family DNA binding protein